MHCESGMLYFWPESVQLRRVVAEVCPVLRTLGTDPRITLGVDIDPAIDDEMLAPWRLKQVLYNYLSNGLSSQGPRAERWGSARKPVRARWRHV
jgi:signal transduction histidine kinase